MDTATTHPDMLHVTLKMIAARLGFGVKKVRKLMEDALNPLPVKHDRARDEAVITEREIREWSQRNEELRQPYVDVDRTRKAS